MTDLAPAQHQRSTSAAPTPCSTSTVLHRAAPAPCSTVQHQHRAAPCSTSTVQHRAAPAPCSTSTVQHQHRAAPCRAAGAADEAGRTGQPPSPRVTLSVHRDGQTPSGTGTPPRKKRVREAGTRSGHPCLTHSSSCDEGDERRGRGLPLLPSRHPHPLDLVFVCRRHQRPRSRLLHTRHFFQTLARVGWRPSPARRLTAPFTPPVGRKKKGTAGSFVASAVKNEFERSLGRVYRDNPRPDHHRNRARRSTT